MSNRKSSIHDDEWLRNTYKRIRFKYDSSDTLITEPIKAKHTKSVSFNTVPSTLGTSSYGDTFEGLKIPLTSKEFNLLRQTSNDLNSLSVHSYNNIDKLFIVTSEGKLVRKDYPSRPTIINDAMIINKYYLNWLQKWQSHKLQLETRMTKKLQYFKYPGIIIRETKQKPIIMDEDYVPLTKEQKRKMTILDTKIPSVNLPRTIICHINGRKHTWVALDWILDIGLHDMDHLVIVSNIPKMKTYHTHNEAKSNVDVNPELWGDSLIYEQNDILSICQNILKYIHLILRLHNKSVKVTVDIVIGKTKKIIIDAINLYTPDLLVVPTLKWERNAKLIENKSNNLKDNLCVNFPIPVCIVPVKRLSQFQLNLQEKINNTNVNDTIYNQEDSNTSIPDNIDDISISPLTTVTSNSSVSSINSFTADYNSEMTTISDNLSISCKEKDNKYKEDGDNLTDEQFLLEIQESPIVSQLYLVAKRCRRRMQDQISQLNDSKDTVNERDYLTRKLDCVVKSSLEGSLMINNIKGNQLSNDVDLKGFARLKRVITGGEPTYLTNSKPMTDVSGYKSPRRSHSQRCQSFGSSKKGSSQIVFASDVKNKDGNRALGNWKSSNQISSSTGPKIPSIIRRVPSNDAVRSMCSDESEKSSMSVPSDSYLHPRRLSMSTTHKKSVSTPASRRNSSSSDKSQGSSSGSKRKMLSKLFGFKT